MQKTAEQGSNDGSRTVPTFSTIYSPPPTGYLVCTLSEPSRLSVTNQVGLFSSSIHPAKCLEARPNSRQLYKKGYDSGSQDTTPCGPHLTPLDRAVFAHALIGKTSSSIHPCTCAEQH